MSAFPVTHSILAAAPLLTKIAADYDLGEPIDGQFLNLGVSDTFRIRTTRDTYILRVYRHGWRTREAILYELEALRHLQLRGATVAVPIARRDGQWLDAVDAPEGQRYLALFRYAAGDVLNFDAANLDADETTDTADTAESSDADRYGRSLAQIHAASDDFYSAHTRFELDLDHLLAQPLGAIAPFLSDRSEDWNYLQQLAQRLQRGLEALPIAQLDRGLCHGDANGGNAHLDADGTLVFFDFDCGGVGWRAYDLAVFRWSVAVNGWSERRWEEFLAGYQAERTIAAIDQHAVPYFVAVRQVWMLGLHCANGDDWGVGWLDRAYFTRALTFLCNWEAQRLSF